MVSALRFHKEDGNQIVWKPASAVGQYDLQG